MSRDLIRQLKSLNTGEVNPRAEWLKSNRELLLSQIKNTIAPAEANKKTDWQNAWSALSIFFPKNFVFNVMRPVTVMLVILSVVTSGWVSTVDAAYEALPGDWLYPAKRATEKTRVTVAAVMGDKKSEAKLHMEFAKRRAQESKKIIASSDPKKTERATQTVSDLKTEIQSATSKLEEIKQDTNTQMPIEVAKEVKQGTEQIKVVLQDVKDTLLTSSSTENSKLSQDLSEAKDLAKDTAIKTVEVVLTKHLEGDTTISKEDVKQVVEGALDTSVKEIAESKQNTEGVNKVLEDAKSEVKDMAKEVAVNKDVAGASSTKDLAQKITAIASETKEAAAKTEAVTVQADKIVAEAKEMLTSGDLTKVLETVKAVSDATKEVEKITDQTLKTVQTVLPMVSVVKENIAPVVLPVPAVSTTSTSTVSTTPGAVPAIVTPIVTSTSILKK